MSEKYKFREEDKAYFVTLTVVDWIDIFTRKAYKIKIVDSLRYCQSHKGLEIYAWCLMSNHLHLICRAGNTTTLSEILRDFKKFTARVILQEIQDQPESRRDWILAKFEDKGKDLKRIEKYKFWQDGNHPELLYSSSIFYQKLKYIHNNPLKEMIVENPEDYFFSSARNYAGLSNLLPVLLETPELITY
jgi:putative transposase